MSHAVCEYCRKDVIVTEKTVLRPRKIFDIAYYVICTCTACDKSGRKDRFDLTVRKTCTVPWCHEPVVDNGYAAHAQLFCEKHECVTSTLTSHGRIRCPNQAIPGKNTAHHVGCGGIL